MLRVALGRARSDTEWSGKISGLEFYSNPGTQASAPGRLRSQGTSHEGFGTSTILMVPQSDLEDEPDADLGTRDVSSNMDTATGNEKLW
jgi:hypothetical protein